MANGRITNVIETAEIMGASIHTVTTLGGLTYDEVNGLADGLQAKGFQPTIQYTVGDDGENWYIQIVEAQGFEPLTYRR
jgi:hypothetical protein